MIEGVYFRLQVPPTLSSARSWWGTGWHKRIRYGAFRNRTSDKQEEHGGVSEAFFQCPANMSYMRVSQIMIPPVKSTVVKRSTTLGLLIIICILIWGLWRGRLVETSVWLLSLWLSSSLGSRQHQFVSQGNRERYLKANQFPESKHSLYGGVYRGNFIFDSSFGNGNARVSTMTSGQSVAWKK